MNLLYPLHNLTIRNKLLTIYSLVIFLALTVTSLFIYSYMKGTIEANIESELQNATTTILNMVRTSAAVSLKNYLRAVAEKNRETTEYFYRLSTNGVLTEDEAKKQAGDMMLRQTIGKSGYIFCINSNGVRMLRQTAAGAHLRPNQTVAAKIPGGSLPEPERKRDHLSRPDGRAAEKNGGSEKRRTETPP